MLRLEAHAARSDYTKSVYACSTFDDLEVDVLLYPVRHS
jgi:hypothetical protein